MEDGQYQLGVQRLGNQLVNGQVALESLQRPPACEFQPDRVDFPLNMLVKQD